MRNRNFRDTVGKFWVVTMPSAESEIGDIVFQTDVMGMILQSRGGLKDTEIIGIFRDQGEAEALAEKLLAGIQQALA